MIPILVLVTCLSVSPPTPGEPASDLPPEAQLHNRQGIAHIESGAHAAGVYELERAYALMPDPLRYRAGRSKVLGSMRSALNHLHQSTGDPAHLHRLHGYLLRHLEALLTALGDTATAEDTAGSIAALQAVEQALARGPARPPTVAAPAPRPTPARPSPAMEPDPAPTGERPSAVPSKLRRAGGALMGVGFVGLGSMTYAVVVHADSRHKLQGLTGAITGSSRPPSDLQKAEAEDLLQRGRTHRTLGIVTGIAAGTAILTGVVLHVIGRRRQNTTARVVPTLAPDLVRMDLSLRF